MKRKYIFILAGFLFLLAGGWLLSGYGSGYSEQQRRLWNERRALFPKDSLFDSISLEYTSGLELAAGLESGKGINVWRGIKRKEGFIDQQLRENRDREGLAWEVQVPERPDLSKLPLEGMARSELVERAEAGDGDASLLLVLRQFTPSNSRFGIAGLSWAELREVERWLGKAVEQKRPGAEFLFQYAGVLKNHLVKIRGVRDRGQGKELNPGNNPPFRSVPGYGEFLHALEQGDNLPWRVAEVISPEAENLPEKKILYDVLKNQTKTGDVFAQRRLAQLYFNEAFALGARSGDVWRQMEQNKAVWKSRLGWLSAGQKDTVARLLAKYGVLEVRDTQEWKQKDEAARFARQAARQGDLTGMYLWLRYGLYSLGRISRTDWEEMFSFARILMEAGYAPYLDDYEGFASYTDEKGKIVLSEFSLHHAILSSYYSGEYFQSSREGVFKGVSSRQGRLWHWGWDENRKNIKELERMGYWDEMWRNAEFMLTRPGKDDKGYYLSLMNRKAAEGDLLAMYYLADVYEKGMTVPLDLGQASQLLQQILLTAGEYPFIRLYYGDKYEQAYMDLTDAARLRLMDMTLRYSAYPGRDEKKALGWADAVAKGKKFSGNAQDGVYCYLLGQIYERGIGALPDRDKALEYYGVPAIVHQGNVHQGCREAWKRLSEQREKSPRQKNAP